MFLILYFAPLIFILVGVCYQLFGESPDWMYSETLEMEAIVIAIIPLVNTVLSICVCLDLIAKVHEQANLKGNAK